ncbi:MAG: DEAD/DEAH box helicase, partial [Nanoarchaeota archaeon]
MQEISLKPREYQQKIFETARDRNTLVVLPTGLGKTLIALMLSIERLKKYPGKKVLILAPTRPLVEQHINSFKKQLPELFADLQLFTGEVPAAKRKKTFYTADVIFSTPQCIANDLKANLYKMEDVSLLVIDEAHRCLKNYDYTTVVEFYKRQGN